MENKDNITQITEDLLNEAVKEMDVVYAFVMESYDNYSQARDYGNGQKMTMVEIHTLSLIANHPGIVITDVAQMWDRTLSAASQNVNKLVKKGLVTKVKEDGNNKSVHLYATDEGKLLSEKHENYDKQQIAETAKKLLEKHTYEELKTTANVLRTGIELYSATSSQNSGRDLA